MIVTVVTIYVNYDNFNDVDEEHVVEINIGML